MPIIIQYLMCYSVAYGLGFISALGLVVYVKHHGGKRASQ